MAAPGLKSDRFYHNFSYLYIFKVVNSQSNLLGLNPSIILPLAGIFSNCH